MIWLCKVIPTNCSHPWEVTNVCTGSATNILAESRVIATCIDVMFDFLNVVIRGIIFGMWADVEIIAAMVGSELIDDASYTVKVLGDTIIGEATGIGAEVKVGALRDMIDTWDFVLLAS